MPRICIIPSAVIILGYDSHISPEPSQFTPLRCSHAEISPQYGGLLASISSSCASVAGACAVVSVGALYKATGSWGVALVGGGARGCQGVVVV